MQVTLGREAALVTRVAGTAERPIVELDRIVDRGAAKVLRGEPLVVDAELGENEWLAQDLVGCRVERLGSVKRVLDGPSCDVLELDDGTLVPLISDAIRSVDLAERRIEVDLGFLRR